MKNLTPVNFEYSQEELLAMCDKMAKASSQFYLMAQATGVHAFIEFCGLMNKYIDVCRAAAQQGIDFTAANVHGGQVLPVEKEEEWPK